MCGLTGGGQWLAWLFFAGAVVTDDDYGGAVRGWGYSRRGLSHVHRYVGTQQVAAVSIAAGLPWGEGAALKIPALRFFELCRPVSCRLVHRQQVRLRRALCFLRSVHVDAWFAVVVGLRRRSH